MLDLNLISCGVASHVQLFGHLGGGCASQSNKPSGIQKRICWNQWNQNGLIHIYGRKGLLSVSGHTRSIMELHTCCLDGSNISGILDYI